MAYAKDSATARYRVYLKRHIRRKKVVVQNDATTTDLKKLFKALYPKKTLPAKSFFKTHDANGKPIKKKSR